VLFIDPDLDSAERLARALPNLSAVAVVPTLQAALSAMNIRVPDLVVTEIDLPDGNGLEFVSRLLATPSTRRVLTIVLTRRTSFVDKIAAFQAGADDYLVKPVDADNLSTHIRLVSRFRQVMP
jgi:DNA-binding response OmpR family regulator